MRHWLTMPLDCKKEVWLATGRVYRCSKCFYGAVMPRPDADDIRSSYELDRYYTHGRSHFAAPGRRTLFDRLREHLAWRVDRGRGSAANHIHSLLAGKPSDICDVGCGSGLLAAELVALGHRVVAVDADPKAATCAASRNIEVFHGSAEDLPAHLMSRQFDIVVMSHVLEHCLDPHRAIENARSLIRPRGLFYCEVPNNACAGFAQVGLAWEMLDIPRHVNFFVPNNLCAITVKAGLDLRRVYYRGYTRQFKNEWINTERRIHDALVSSGTMNMAMPKPAKNSTWHAWRLLTRTAFARAELKYDSVGVVAVKPI
jgi:2-polyprenyl-3-methyl-5-hydroxy-6-metoxy-1,4-benzoquinol methylase